MPVSDYHGVSAIMGEILRLSPKSVLELGIGFGKWGVLCRELLDAAYGRCRREQWQALIFGVEVWPGYSNPAWEMYNDVAIEDLQSRDNGGWDLVMLIDSLEHLNPDEGRPFLRKLVGLNSAVIVSVPNGRMDQGEVFGNPYEAHKWTFEGLEEFAPYNFAELHRGVCTVVSIQGFK